MLLSDKRLQILVTKLLLKENTLLFCVDVGLIVYNDLKKIQIINSFSSNFQNFELFFQSRFEVDFLIRLIISNFT